MYEIREYKNVPTSAYGFQWVTIDERETQEEAEAVIADEVSRNGKNRGNLSYRKKQPKQEVNAPYFHFSSKRRENDTPHSERRRRWNSGNPSDALSI